MVNSPLKLGASHLPVLASEAVAALQVDQGGVFIDCTLGRAGHSKLILSALGGSGRLICLDRDPQAIAFAQKAIGKDPRVTLVHSAFSDIDKILESHGLLDGSVDGVLLDLGVSSPQLDQAERGFSFRTDGPLDMRMDNSSGQTAAKWLAYAEVEEIADVLWRYGEERQSRRIARAIVEFRSEQAIETTKQLADIIKNAVVRPDKHKHPATRSFQALRIFLNDELQQLLDVLPKILRILKTAGRLVVISFHSLEDRIVKRFMRDHARGSQAPKNIPLPANQFGGTLRLVGKPIRAGSEELRINPRARSAVMRVAERSEVAYA
ncbi:MAG: 16S rRNA (cytosine(1402)-N(4))-methyltransferase RsmH [Proteobacteria bacterium]|jgi:16S rRNA (cytosine1402-N4)-methyltransferase|nr:16S rRNA (cytosine(1402)-N(4))-methyltransferase RsmH [Pseudomonadota bacterium]